MLIRFRVSNFKSIRDEQEFSMVAGDIAGPTEPLRHVEGLDVDLLTVAAIYGPNASGKSTVLEALRFILTAVSESHRWWKPEGPIPRHPFLLDLEMMTEPSLFEIEFVLGSTRYRYGFILDSERVREEWLYAYPKGRKQVWFVRNVEEVEPFRFGKHLVGDNRTVQSITRQNSLFLSSAAQNNHVRLLPVYRWLATQAKFSKPGERTARLLGVQKTLTDPASRSFILSLLGFADLGIVGLDVGEEQQVLRFDDMNFQLDILTGAPPASFKLRHKAAGVQEGVAIPFSQESQGTQALLSLATNLMTSLRHGSIMCIDELDASLHPAVAREVVRMFHDPKANPSGAQLIFNTHDTNLLDSQLEGARLRRDQIWFTEKDDTGATHLYPLTDFKPRADENLERGYLQGRYGAIPVVGSLSFLRDAAPTNGEASE